MADQGRYKIVRYYFRTERRVTIKTNLTIEEAQAQCKDPESSSKTCCKSAANKRTRIYGEWFDGYAPH